MKNILTFALLLAVVSSCFAQFPPNAGRQTRLGYGTTADGLTFRGSGYPNYTPSTLRNAYAYVDTVENRMFYYAKGRWNRVSESAYVTRTDSTIFGDFLESALLQYDFVTCAMYLTSSAVFDEAVELPVSNTFAIDSSYAGRIVRIAALDSSATRIIFVASSSPNGLAIGDSTFTQYNMVNGETVEFQLYYFDTIFQWRLINSTLGGGSGSDGNGLISALPLTNVTINASDNSLRIDSLKQLQFFADGATNTAKSRLILPGLAAVPAQIAHFSVTDTAQILLQAQNVFSESQITLKSESVFRPKYTTKTPQDSVDYLIGIDANGYEQLIHPDSLPKLLEVISALTAAENDIDALQDSISVLRDSINVLRTAITALQSATSAPLRYFEFSIGNATGWLIATDTAGLAFTLSSGTATFTIPTNVASYNLSFRGQDSDLPGNDLTIVINQTSSVLNQGGTSTVPRHFEVISRPDASSAPSGSAPFVYGSPTSPQRRIEGQTGGNVTLRVVNIKNAYDFWTVSLMK